MNYNVFWSTFVRYMTTPSLWTVELLKWLELLISEVQSLHSQFLSYRAVIIKQLRYNGQVIILENLLNDIFDITNRDIYIETINDSLTAVYLYQPGEDTPEGLYQPVENQPLYLFQPGEPLSTGYDFIVWVPDGILTSEQEGRIKAVTNKYKLAGKKANFQYYPSNTTF